MRPRRRAIQIPKRFTKGPTIVDGSGSQQLWTGIPEDNAFPQFTNAFSVMPGNTAYPLGSFVPGSGTMTGAGGTAFKDKFKTYVGMDTQGLSQYNAEKVLSVVVPDDNFTPSYFDLWHRVENGTPYSMWLRPKTTPELKYGGMYFAWYEIPPIPGFGFTAALISEKPRGFRSDGVERTWIEFSDENDTPELSMASQEISASWHPWVGDFGGHPIVHHRDVDMMLRMPGGVQFLTQKFAPDGDFPGAIIERVRRPDWPAGKWALWFRQGAKVGPQPESWTIQSGAHQSLSSLPLSEYGDGHMRIYAIKTWDQIPGTRPEPVKDIRFPDDFSTILGNPQSNTGAQTRAMAFKVTEECTFEGVTFYSPGSSTARQTATAQLWRGTELIDSRTISGMGNGRYLFRMPERTLDVAGDWQIQIAMEDGHQKYTVTTLPSASMTVGPVTTVGVTNPFRFGSNTSVRATSTGAAWCGMSVMVQAANPVQFPPGVAVVTPPETTVQTYLARSGTDLTLNGKKWRGAGINWHWAGLRETTLTYPTHAMIDEILDECKSMGAAYVRAHTLGMSAGLPQSLVTGINADGSLIWNNAAWEPIDYAIQQAKARGIRLMIPFTDQFNYYHKGKQWWVQQAFVQRATSNIPTTYTYNNGATTETNVTSFDPNSGSVSGSARYKIISQQFYRNTWIRNAFINNYVGAWFEHVNQYTGVANKNEPTIAFAQMGNELWDSGDQYADHAGADGVSCVAQFNAKVKEKQPKVLTVDPMGADGVDPNWAPGRNDVNEDIIDATHLYRNGQSLSSGYVKGFADKVAAFGKVATFGEYPINNSGLSIALSEMEQSSATMGGAFWAIYSSSEGHTQGGVDDTVYLIGQNASWKQQFQTHAAVMSDGTVPTPPVLTNLLKSAPVANSEAATSNYATGAVGSSFPSLALDSTGGVGGGSALKVTATGSDHKWIYINNPTVNGAPVTPGSTYSATGQVKLVSGTLSSGYYGHLTWFKADGTYISGATANGAINASGSFQQVTFSGVAPANAAYAVPQIEFDGPASGTAVLLIDQWVFLLVTMLHLGFHLDLTSRRIYEPISR